MDDEYEGDEEDEDEDDEDDIDEWIDEKAENEIQSDHITIINPRQPVTLKDGHYTLIGTPMLMSNQALQ